MKQLDNDGYAGTAAVPVPSAGLRRRDHPRRPVQRELTVSHDRFVWTAALCNLSSCPSWSLSQPEPGPATGPVSTWSGTEVAVPEALVVC